VEQGSVATTEPVETEQFVEQIEASPVEIAAVNEWPGSAAEFIGSENGAVLEGGNEPASTVEAPMASEPERVIESEFEPVAQGQPVPYQMSVSDMELAAAEVVETEVEQPRHEIPLDAPVATVDEVREHVFDRIPEPVIEVRESVIEIPPFASSIVSTAPSVQPTTSVIMPEPIQTPTAPVIRTPSTGGSPQPASAMQTAVQLTFSFEIASMQLTPTFKMGALQLRPTSKIVTMRLAPSQQPQPAMNLQVTFEIATVQAAGGGIGQIRLTPSQQQRPSVISSPAFNIAGLQLLSGSDAGAVQLTPSQQGQASVHVTGRFQIATVEFSPSFEIASLVLNATSKSVSVQLPGAGPSAVEGAPVFEIANVQITGNGEIGMMQLNAQGAAPKAA
jgi:hypothetical protein